MASEHPEDGDDKSIALDFLRKVVAGKITEAYERHVGPAFCHHNPYFAGDADSLKKGMEANAVTNPHKIFEVQRAVHEGDLVVVHSRLRQHEHGPAFAVVHIMRFEDHRIVEMWDIGQAEPENMVNERGMF